ncbi:MAG: response regulator [Ignavibacteria bacterium]|nr:response regulator [Ignavibacteria bacterium]
MKKMLVVEDDLLSQKVLIRLFKKDFEINTVESVERFYEEFNGVSYDIIIMDIALRGIKHGLELTREMRSSEIYKNTPILCLTAHALLKDRTLALDSGVDAYLTKPVTNKVLRETVKRLIEEK